MTRARAVGPVGPCVELEPPVAAEMLWGILSIPLWDQLVTDLGWSRLEYRERITLLARGALTASRPT